MASYFPTATEDPNAEPLNSQRQIKDIISRAHAELPVPAAEAIMSDLEPRITAVVGAERAAGGLTLVANYKGSAAWQARRSAERFASSKSRSATSHNGSKPSTSRLSSVSLARQHSPASSALRSPA